MGITKMTDMAVSAEGQTGGGSKLIKEAGGMAAIFVFALLCCCCLCFCGAAYMCCNFVNKRDDSDSSYSSDDGYEMPPYGYGGNYGGGPYPGGGFGGDFS